MRMRMMMMTKRIMMMIMMMVMMVMMRMVMSQLLRISLLVQMFVWELKHRPLKKWYLPLGSNDDSPV